MIGQVFIIDYGVWVDKMINWVESGHTIIAFSPLVLDRSAIAQEARLISERPIRGRDRSESNRSCERAVLISLSPPILAIICSMDRLLMSEEHLEK